MAHKGVLDHNSTNNSVYHRAKTFSVRTAWVWALAFEDAVGHAEGSAAQNITY